jgi:hypothetical protein
LQNNDIKLTKANEKDLHIQETQNPSTISTKRSIPRHSKNAELKDRENLNTRKE